MIHLGITTDGKEISIPVWHTGIFGQSGVGKTKLLKYMIPQAIKEGYTVVIIDSKSNNLGGPEFEGFGRDVPFYLEESTDPDIFRSLIEGMRPRGRGNMARYRGGFIEICDKCKSFEQIGKNLDRKLNDPKIRGWTKGMYQEIKYDFDKLMALLGEEKFSSSFEVNAPLVRVPTYRLPNLALQGLVVKSIVEYILRHFAKVVVLIDEAPDFVPQRKFSPAKDALQQLDAKGRSSKDFGWYSGQTLTGFDKSNMKNLWYWALGREMETNEKKDAWETQSIKNYNVDHFGVLKVRHFVVSTPEFTTEVEVPLLQEEGQKIVEDYVHADSTKAAGTHVSKEESWDDVIEKIREVRAMING